MDPTPHILVVDDHKEIRDLLGKYLSKNGMRASVADGAATARRMLGNNAIDLVVLDVMMPGEDGISLCRHIRETVDIPTILLTAMGEETDRIVGLEVGADDYVTKPFNPRELLARIKTVLRRAHSIPKTAMTAPSERFSFDRWTFNVAQRELIDEKGVTVPLSTGEFLMLEAFVARPNVVLSRDQLLDITRGRAPNVFDRSIDNQVSRLRKKIEEDPKNPKIIKTVWGGGYQFVAAVETP